MCMTNISFSPGDEVISTFKPSRTDNYSQIPIFEVLFLGTTLGQRKMLPKSEFNHRNRHQSMYFKQKDLIQGQLLSVLLERVEEYM